MNMIWLPVAVPLVVMAVMVAMDHLQRWMVDGGPRPEDIGAVRSTATHDTP